MPNEIKAAVAIEEGLVFLEKNPGALNKIGEFVAEHYREGGMMGLAALALAGCSKNKNKAADSQTKPSPEASKVLHSHDAPGATGPGTPAGAAKGDQNSGVIQVFSNIDDKVFPKNLPLLDIPAQTEKNRQYVWGNVDHLELHTAGELYTASNYGALGKHDLRPASKTAPLNDGSQSNLYAVALDKGGKPVDILQYYDPGTGTKYQEQYQFKYDQLAGGTNTTRVTVMDWKDSKQTTDVGPQQIIGNKLNTLEGVSQYYYDATGKCTEALYYNGWSMNAPRADWKPAVDMKFNGDQLSISERNANSGQMTPFYTPATKYEADLTIQAKAAKLKFFDLLGPGK